ncbi:hypothetical protein LguiA_030073 [Lonicera macranthoides]
MKLHKISSVILLIMILVAGCFIPHAAEHRGHRPGPCTNVEGCKPPGGGLP